MKALGRTALVGALAIAIVGLGVPWGALFANAADNRPVLEEAWLEVVPGQRTTDVNEVARFTVNGRFTDADAEMHMVEVQLGPSPQFSPITTSLRFGDRTFSLSNSRYVYSDDNPTGTDHDPFDLTVKVIDETGLESETWIVHVTVHNVAPSINSFTVSASSILDHGSVDVTATFSDPGTRDTWTLTLDWGDHSSSAQRYVTGDPKSFAGSHQYVDAGNYTLTLTVTDDDTGSVSVSSPLDVIARNTAPSALTLGFAAAVEGEPLWLNGQFTDPDLGDTHTVLVRWGDTASSEYRLEPDVASFSVSHVYSSEGTKTVEVVVTDSAGASTQPERLDVTVLHRNHAPADLAVSTTGTVAGGQGAVHVRFTDVDASDTHNVHISWGDGRSWDYPLAVGVFSYDGTHTYATAGTYTVGIEVTDQYGLGVSGEASLEVRTLSAGELLDELAALIRSWHLDLGTETSLMAKVDSARGDLAQSRDNVCNALNALANSVTAQTDKKLSVSQVEAFWSEMTNVNGAVPCATQRAAEPAKTTLRDTIRRKI